MTGSDEENGEDFFLTPATDGQMEAQLSFEAGPFMNFPSPTAMTQLAAAGIVVRTWDLICLGAAMRTLRSLPNMHFSKEAVERETRMAALSRELAELLAAGGDDDGWRCFWGNADWSDFDETLEQPDPEETIDVKGLQSELVALGKSAAEQLEWLTSAKYSAIEPQSNRAERTRYFYWLLLIGFWRYQLQRAIGTCTAPDRDAYGPLVTFIRVMSAQGMTEEETKGTTIRAFIRRFAPRSAHFADFFTPHS